MIILKCEMCGANITPQAGISYATCEYCGSTMTLFSENENQKKKILYMHSKLY